MPSSSPRSSPPPRARSGWSSFRPPGRSCPSSRTPRALPSTDPAMTTHTTPEPPRRRADAERSIARILDAAVDALADDPEASMAEIARRAGVVRATIYVHFPTREALLDAVMEHAVAQVAEATREADPTRGKPEEALERVLLATCQKLSDFHALLAINTGRLSAKELHRR